jgi:Putative bacterial sensory transduction regulator
VTAHDEAVSIIRDCLVASEIEYAEPEPGAFAANLPGQRRLRTACWLDVGRSSLAIQAFVMRHPDENAAAVHGWLLAHNARMFGVAWSIDDAGDIYLTGRWPLVAVTQESVDLLLGCVLDYADSAFNTLLQLGFGSSIKREWEWRVSRGESLANLSAFADFVSRARAGD